MPLKPTIYLYFNDCFPVEHRLSADMYSGPILREELSDIWQRGTVVFMPAFSRPPRKHCTVWAPADASFNCFLVRARQRPWWFHSWPSLGGPAMHHSTLVTLMPSWKLMSVDVSHLRILLYHQSKHDIIYLRTMSMCNLIRSLLVHLQDQKYNKSQTEPYRRQPLPASVLLPSSSSAQVMLAVSSAHITRIATVMLNLYLHVLFSAENWRSFCSGHRSWCELKMNCAVSTRPSFNAAMLPCTGCYKPIELTLYTVVLQQQCDNATLIIFIFTTTITTTTRNNTMMPSCLASLQQKRNLKLNTINDNNWYSVNTGQIVQIKKHTRWLRSETPDCLKSGNLMFVVSGENCKQHTHYTPANQSDCCALLHTGIPYDEELNTIIHLNTNILQLKRKMPLS